MPPLVRLLSTAARTKLRIGLIPADGIGKEVIPVSRLPRCLGLVLIAQAARDAILAVGSAIPKPEFVNLDAGFEYFTRHGEALPDNTLQ